jgi:hypothetical protein
VKWVDFVRLRFTKLCREKAGNGAFQGIPEA